MPRPVPGQASNPPNSEPMLKAIMVAVASSPTVHGSALAILADTVSGKSLNETRDRAGRDPANI